MTDTKIALVTGANKGIGYQIAAQLVELGTTVLLAARDRERREKAAAELGAHPIALDVTDPSSATAAAEEVGRRFGRLDVLVNNAGIAGPWEQGPGTGAVDVARAVFETNVLGVIAVTDAMLPLLLRSPAPRVVNVSSGVASLTAMSDPGHRLAALPAGLAYPPSKTALNAVTVQYAKALREHGVLVNAADPGFCATDLNGHRGHRTAAQGAAVAVRLATLGPDGPTGGFHGEDGPLPW
ncbi:SDR family oxidoreductase [Saccharothrix syringae]|uniref:SDR family oxidoreductase n=1 Tax=Saccharothrix syringae TaxID=103733 RepID=A0A5Q0H2T2_SACSY|nr:SDR family oxidoreductase [Saccharothrix syringae]QFZ20235.1 SDR family oxidoreductase [Saccharothrix syringae]